MYKEHSAIEKPADSLVIWRYMELWKFLDIIDNKKLYMSRCDLFEDKYDGRIPVKSVSELDDEHPLKQVDNFSESTLRKCSYLSCWSSEQKETYPLWKIYSDYRNSVAIKTTVGDLIESISQEKSAQQIGKVKYIDSDGPYRFRGNTYQFFFEKRNYFIFEKEVRILTELQFKDYTELLNLPLGITIEIDPNKLINEIVLAPKADMNFKKLIELKLKDSNILAKVSFSDI